MEWVGYTTSRYSLFPSCYVQALPLGVRSSTDPNACPEHYMHTTSVYIHMCTYNHKNQHNLILYVHLYRPVCKCMCTLGGLVAYYIVLLFLPKSNIHIYKCVNSLQASSASWPCYIMKDSLLFHCRGRNCTSLLGVFQEGRRMRWHTALVE